MAFLYFCLIFFIFCQDICNSVKEEKYNFGESGQITCDIANLDDDVKWYHDNVQLQSRSNIFIQGNTLHIYCLEQTNAGEYRCEHSSKSEVYLLTVLNPANETFFLMYNQVFKKCLMASGAQILLDSCDDKCHKKWRWNSKHQLVNRNKCLSVSTLKAGAIVSLENCDQSSYNKWECANDRRLKLKNSDFYFSKSILNNFILKTDAQHPDTWLNYVNRQNICSKSPQEPTVVVDPDHVVLSQDETVTIECKAFNFKNLVFFEWWKNGEDISGQSDLNHHIGSPDKLIIPFAYSINIGYYTCVARSLNITANATTRIEVFQDPFVVQNNISQTANIGDDVHLSCQIYTKKTNQNRAFWYKDGLRIFNNDSRYQISSTKKGPFSKFWLHLHLTSLTFNDRGVYKCGINGAMVQGDLLIYVEPKVQISRNDKQLRCSVSGFPTPRVNWYKDNKLDKLTSKNITMTKDIVNYTCVASNLMGTSYDSYIISAIPVVEKSKGSNDVLIGCLVAAIIVLIIIFIIVFCCWKKKRKAAYNNNTTTEENNYTTVRYESTPGLLSGEERAPRTQIQFHPRCNTDPSQQKSFSLKTRVYNSMKPRSRAEWEIPQDCLIFDEKLGEGQFGQVWKGRSLSRSKGEKTVAIKMLKDNADIREKKSLIDELEFMKTMTPHPNIVSLVGCCTRSERVLLVVEYVPHGNLKDFLLQSRGNSKEIYSNLAPYSKSLASSDLVSFAYQIARGMSYLEKVKRVHRDLAARNILIGENQTCKIADFGLARDIYSENYYRKTTGGRLPLRWMAYESIFKGITTSQSDAWSFGVLLWEIVTLGGNPYPAMTRDQLIEGLQRGYRMPKPHHCADEIYSIMCDCWQQNPDKRPTFAELTTIFLRLISIEQIYINTEIFGETDYVAVGCYELTEK